MLCNIYTLQKYLENILKYCDVINFSLIQFLSNSLFFQVTFINYKKLIKVKNEYNNQKVNT